MARKTETSVKASSGIVDFEFIQIMIPRGRIGPLWVVKIYFRI